MSKIRGTKEKNKGKGESKDRRSKPKAGVEEKKEQEVKDERKEGCKTKDRIKYGS